MESLQERVVAHCKTTVGTFHTTSALTRALGVSAEELRASLIVCYRLGLIDRLVRIEQDQMIGHYGHHRGVQPGTALLNNTQKGLAA